MYKDENFVIVNDIENKKFQMTDEECLDIINQIENKKINVKKTIEKAAKADFLGAKHYYVSPLSQHGEFSTEIPKLLNNGKTYEDNLDDEFIEKALECIENEDGIYITLVYASSERGYGEELIFRKKDFDYEAAYKDLELDYPKDYENDIGIESATEGVICNFHEFDEIEADMTSDYGIYIRKVNNSYETRIGQRVSGLHCWGPQGLTANWMDVPFDRVILRLIFDGIVFKE